MNKQRLTILIVAAVGAFSTFLPWVNVPFLGSINGTASNEWNTLFYFSITIILCVVGNRANRLKGIAMYVCIITAILAGLIGVDTISKIDGNSILSSGMFAADRGAFAGGTSPAIGLYLIVLAGFAIPFIAFLVKDKVDPIKE